MLRGHLAIQQPVDGRQQLPRELLRVLIEHAGFGLEELAARVEVEHILVSLLYEILR